MTDRKKDHIDLAFRSQANGKMPDSRFFYEPVLGSHADGDLKPVDFLGKKLKAPIWISSMTGGTEKAGIINRNLARACNEFGLGMGLGSCRKLLESDEHFDDFNLRDLVGDEQPFYANLGINQVERIVRNNNTHKISELITRLRADGLIIHVNPLQEWLQPEGDRLEYSPLDTIKMLLDKAGFKIIIKEVGQGMGPESLKELLSIPVDAIEFGAYGGTNFSKLEMLRDETDRAEVFDPASQIGHTATEMVGFINDLVDSGESILCSNLIISGGIKNFLDGYYLMKKSLIPAIYGQGSAFLRYAKEDYEGLRSHISLQIQGLEMAAKFLKIRD